MGGNAIKTVKVSRINLDTYNFIKNRLINDLSPKLILLDFAYDIPNKIDFGDLDVLYKAPTNLDFRKLIIDKYNPDEIVSNGNVMSISYHINNEYYQVDFVKCSNLEMSKFFFSYGDLGGVIGTITKNYGISYGEGLWCNINKDTIKNYTGNDIEDYTTTKIFLSDKPSEICKYLDLDYEKWISGFDTKESIFEWVISSSWFQRDIFLNLNCFEKRKSNIRPFYKNFIEYIFDENKFYKRDRDQLKKYNRQLEALKFFNKVQLLDDVIKENNIKNERKMKFNGYKFMKYGYTNKDIGILILEFKKYINKKFDKVNNMEFFNIWLDNNDEINIDKEIDNFIINEFPNSSIIIKD